MRTRFCSILAGLLVVGSAPVVPAQDVGELFRTINPSVVGVRAKGPEVTAARGISTFGHTGSRV